jgi:hypothetical protein
LGSRRSVVRFARWCSFFARYRSRKEAHQEEKRGGLRPSPLAKIDELARSARTSLHCRSRNGNALVSRSIIHKEWCGRKPSHEAWMSPWEPGNPGTMARELRMRVAFFDRSQGANLRFARELVSSNVGCRSAYESKHGCFQGLGAWVHA